VSKHQRRGIKPTAGLPAQPAPRKRISEPVSVSFRFIQEGATHCLSQCTRDEVRQYTRCLRILTTKPWNDVLASGGARGVDKAGLGHTAYPDSILSGVHRPPSLSPELTISAVRASQRARLFGAYDDGVYYILWFDRDHGIVAR